MKLSLERKLFFTFLVIIILLSITFVLYNRSNKKFEDTSKWLTHSKEVLYHISNIETLITEIESSTRGQILGASLPDKGSEEQIYNLTKEFDTLHNLVADNYEQSRFVDSLHILSDMKNSFMLAALDTFRMQGFEPARAMISSGGGVELMEHIKLTIHHLQENENVLMKQRNIEFSDSEKQLTRRFFTLSVFIIVILFSAYLIIVTELRLRRKAENNLLFESFMADNAHDAIVGTDTKFNVRFCNKASERFSGKEAGKVLGESIVGLFTVEYAENASREIILKKIIEKGEWEGELIHILPSGERVNVILSVTRIKNREQEPIGYVYISHDITERIESERRITFANNELQKNNLQLQTLNSDLESFTYSVSHDLRTPLRAINGYTNMLKRFVNDREPESNRLMQLIHDNVKRMADLINDLLNFSHVSRRELVKTKTEMEDLVRNCVDDSLRNAPNPHLEFRIGSLLPCVCDTNMMHHVWENLIANAVKYSSKEQSPGIDINSYRKNNSIVYSIRDNGAGFDMKYYDKLFGVFQRLHDQDEFEGTGVGLAIVERIVSKHGGTIWAESKPGEGAIFYFSIPDNFS